MPDVTITGMERTRFAEPTANGHLILAYFTTEIAPFKLKGCAFVRTGGGRLDIWLPNLTDKKARNVRSITLNDDSTKRQLLAEAIRVFRTMGGTAAELQGRFGEADDEPEPPCRDRQPRTSLGTTVDEELARMLPPPITREPLKRTITRVIVPVRRVENGAAMENTE